MPKPGPSEFERTGPARSGEIPDAPHAFERARLQRRTEQEVEQGEFDLQARPDKFEKGGNTVEQNGDEWWINEG